MCALGPKLLPKLVDYQNYLLILIVVQLTWSVNTKKICFFKTLQLREIGLWISFQWILKS